MSEISKEDFVNQMKDLMVKHKLDWSWNSDLWSLVDGMLFYKEGQEEPLFEIKGVHSNGDGDRDGFLKILQKSILEFNL